MSSLSFICSKLDRSCPSFYQQFLIKILHQPGLFIAAKNVRNVFKKSTDLLHYLTWLTNITCKNWETNSNAFNQCEAVSGYDAGWKIYFASWKPHLLGQYFAQGNGLFKFYFVMSQEIIFCQKRLFLTKGEYFMPQKLISASKNAAKQSRQHAGKKYRKYAQHRLCFVNEQ